MPGDPSYACLVMGFWEERCIYDTVHNPFHSKISLWRRYIDDVLLIWKGSFDELNNFLTYVNSTTNYLSFTMEYNDQSIDFLDLTIFKDVNNTLQSTIHRKPLSRNTLLKADSNHPSHLLRNIPVGQFFRVRRNCSTTTDFMSKASQLVHGFEQRGYHKVDIIKAWDRASKTERADLLKKKSKHTSTTSRLSFSACYTPAAGRIKLFTNIGMF